MVINLYIKYRYFIKNKDVTVIEKLTMIEKLTIIDEIKKITKTI